LVPLTQTSQEAEHWQAEMHNLLLDQETFGTRGILLPSKADKPKFAYNLLDFTYKNFDALDKSSTQFDLGTNFFWTGNTPKSQHNIQQDLFTLLHLIPQDQIHSTTTNLYKF
jgi:hypothetical protein